MVRHIQHYNFVVAKAIYDLVVYLFYFLSPHIIRTNMHIANYAMLIHFIAVQFTCGVDCVGVNICENGLQQKEFHLILNLYRQLVTRDRCNLFKNEHFKLPCRIGTEHCVVNATTSSDDFYMVICTTNYGKITSERIYLNATFPSCAG